ncbi:hypothetical protein Patl1_23622 [Pistacia atlantica]|uniref:Uncharacterized protein n=1 Tax=Pistacia atlantica TaxID=434234 RepID=A0ACC0ZVT4_9ROSI|nr:hypothetical protein Patl1_23622 [Pistacia atlantica]
MDLLLICLPTSIEPHILTDPYSLLTKEKITRRIESGGQSAAAVLCCVGKEFPPHESRIDFIEDIVGLVALIGKAWTIKLSRLMVGASAFLQKMKAHNHLMEVAAWKGDDGDWYETGLHMFYLEMHVEEPGLDTKNKLACWFM